MRTLYNRRSSSLTGAIARTAIILLTAISLSTVSELRSSNAKASRAAQASMADAMSNVDCASAVVGAERAHGIPTGLLMAIAQVESGRWDPRTGLIQPWPWSINVGGQGYFLDSRLQAISYVEDLQRSGVASIDTGCLQVNLQQHPTAFRSVQEAFDPHANADYAARFLVRLYRETGDWGIASGYYHSRTPELSVPYRLLVATRFPGLMRNAAAAQARPDPAQPLQALAAAWAATLPTDGTLFTTSLPVSSHTAPQVRFLPSSALRFSAR